MKTCYELYKRNPTGLGPEIAYFPEDGNTVFENKAAKYILRPETVESLFILYIFTDDKKYQDWGWEIFKAIERNCRTQSAFTSIEDVGNKNSKKLASMQSFFMAETLKYLYLLFSPRELIPLDKYVFNTEAHPLKILENKP